MLLSNQQKYILEILKEFKYLRVRQLHALVQAHYRTQGIKIDERRMEIMLRQMRTGTNYVWLRGDVVSYGDRRIDPRLWKHWTLCWSLQGCSPDFTRKTDCMNHFSCALPETERGPDTFSAWHGWTPLLTLQPSPV